MDGSSLRPPRPVADVPAIDPVALTKAWLVGLVADAPLARAAELPAAELARGGPPLCGALLAALGTDRELERLQTAAAGTAAMIGASNGVEIVAGVEALRRAAGRAVRAALGDGDADIAADLAERLAHLCALVAGEALAAHPGDPGGTEVGAPPAGARIAGLDDPAGHGRIGDPLSSLADELATGPLGPPVAPPASAPALADAPTVRRREPSGWDGHAAAAPPWLGAIVRQLERHSRDRRPFAVLLAEVDGLDRLLAGGVAPEVAAALDEAERALTAELAPADLVVRERLGRWWLTTPERDSAGARALAGRVAAAVRSAVLHGAALTASVGVAACPDDGADLDALAGRADEGMYAARAAGVPVA